MFIDSKYTKSFYSHNLTRSKYDELYNHAILIRNHKNEISQIVSKNLNYFLEMSKFVFMKHFRDLFPNTLSSNFYNQCYTDIFTCYQNKFESIQKKLNFELSKLNKPSFYKRDTKSKKKGDLKEVSFTKYKTKLTVVLSYLARYGNENTLFYIKQLLLNDDLPSSKKELFKDIVFYCEKYSFERLLKLALLKRENVFKKYSNPIEFKSLTFRGRSRKKQLISYNKRFSSKINGFISLSWSNEKKTLDIPIKFNKHYHGNIKDYIKKSNDYEYIIKFNERKKDVIINICKDGKRYIPKIKDTDEVVGIDVNVKNNLFCLSNGDVYDFNRKLLKDYTDLMNTIEKTNQIGKRKQHKINVLKNKMLKGNQNLISTMCKDLQSKGIKQLSLENLENGFGKSFVKDKNHDDINFNRIVSFLKISSLKEEIEHIGRKYDIGVSLVHSSYTSKQCNKCGCIEDENRLTQEEFKCVECGYTENADLNASLNIKKRVSETVFRDALLKNIGNGVYRPKILSRVKVKEMLLSFR